LSYERYFNLSEPVCKFSNLAEFATSAPRNISSPSRIGSYYAEVENYRQSIAVNQLEGIGLLNDAFSGHYVSSGSSAQEILNSPGLFRGMVVNSGDNLQMHAAERMANLKLESETWAAAAAVPVGLKTGAKANVNGLSRAAAGAVSLGSPFKV
jgi:hypothetical protein